MFCPHCGQENANEAEACSRCGATISRVPPVPTVPTVPYATTPLDVPNYLVQAILCTCFCCLPLGIVAIVYAAQVNSNVAAGRIAEALAASGAARKWCWYAFLGALAPMGLWLIAAVILPIVGCLGGGARAPFIYPQF